METKPQKLWTKNFTIITVGSLISMLGSSVAGWAMGLLVYAETQDSLAYAAFMIIYSLPRILLPLLVGPILDRFSRRRVIYVLDFISAGMYLILFILLYQGFFQYFAFLAASVVIGSIDSVYGVAYESFYPNLISKGNFRKAYSVSSLLWPLSAAVMIPIAGIAYTVSDKGISFLFLFNAVTFLIAAIFETRIRVHETQTEKAARQTLRTFFDDLKEGVRYLKREKGLAVITAYFFCTTLLGSISQTFLQPYFMRMDSATVPALFGTGVMLFTILMAMGTFGRLAGGGIQYFTKYPTDKKFAIAVFVYLSICVLEGSYLFLPNSLWWLMGTCTFCVGILGVNSYNIRIAATQSYVPDSVRGRFNGVFQMFNMLGAILGQLLGGIIGKLVIDKTASVTLFGASFVVSIPMVMLLINLVNIACVFLVMVRGKADVKKIYNVPV